MVSSFININFSLAQYSICEILNFSTVSKCSKFKMSQNLPINNGRFYKIVKYSPNA